MRYIYNTYKLITNMLIKTVDKSRKSCINILILIFIFFSNTLYSQKYVLYINSPLDSGAVVKVLAYDYFKSDTAGIFKLNNKGCGTFIHNYQGFSLIYIGHNKQFPLILQGASNTLKINPQNGMPEFVNDKENDFLYRHLIQRDQIYRKEMAVNESFKFFNEDDPFYPELVAEKTRLELLEQSYNKSLYDSSGLFSATLLLARELMETSYGIRTQAELNNRKAAFLEFIKANLKTLRHSDMLQQLARQYVMMNEYISGNQYNDYDQIIKDIDDWIKYFGKHIGNKETVEFFMNFYAGRSMFSMAGKIANRYPEVIICKVKLKKIKTKGQTFSELDVKLSKGSDNSVKLKNIPSTHKILYFYKDDCIASLVQNVMLYRYISSKTYNIPAITVFQEGAASKNIELLGKISPGVFHYTENNAAFKLAHIKKTPYYILLDGENKKEKKFDNFEKLKIYIEKKLGK